MSSRLFRFPLSCDHGEADAFKAPAFPLTILAGAYWNKNGMSDSH